MTEEAKKHRLSSISNAKSYEEIGEFWDNHSLVDYQSETEETNIEVRARRRHRVILQSDLYERIERQARQQGLMPETLIHLWLSESSRKAG